jgi:DNA-binding NarL/FixJ family response regulator
MAPHPTDPAVQERQRSALPGGPGAMGGPERGVARVLVAADHPVMRLGLTTLVGTDDAFRVCAEASTAAEAAETAAAEKPDLAIVDMSHEPMGGIGLVKALRAASPSTRVLLLSMHDENILAERALRAGAAGYVMKRQPAAEIMAAARRVLAGELYMSEPMRERMLRRHVKGASEDAHPTEALSDREMEVLQLIGSGHGTREIAARLGLSAKTIDSHRENLKRKLGLSRGSDLVRLAVEWSRSGALP